MSSNSEAAYLIFTQNSDQVSLSPCILCFIICLALGPPETDNILENMKCSNIDPEPNMCNMARDFVQDLNCHYGSELSKAELVGTHMGAEAFRRHLLSRFSFGFLK